MKVTPAFADRGVTVFMFNDEDEAYSKWWEDSISNRSCTAIKQYAKAEITPGADGVTKGSLGITGDAPSLWYIVAVDCNTRQCPNISSAEISSSPQPTARQLPPTARRPLPAAPHESPARCA